MNDPNPKDECVCGCWRDQHAEDTGFCLLNLAHPHEPCSAFQLYRRAADGPHLDKRQSVADFCDLYQRCNW